MPNALTRHVVVLARRLGVAVILIGFWWAVVAILAIEPFILPGPDRVARALLVRAPDLLAAARTTGLEMVIGLLVGVLVGVATATLMALVPWSGRLLSPVIVVVQTLPVFAVAPLLVNWFGFGLASKIVMATLVIFFPVASSFHDGLLRTDPGLLDLARLHRAGTFATFRLLRWPAARPALVSGLRMAATVAPIGAVIGEWVGASSGLGLLMMHANARMQTDVLFAALAVLAAMALVLRGAVDRLTRDWAPWAPEIASPAS